MMTIDALGFVEVLGYVAALEAADAMLKTADVRLLAVHELNPGMITVEVEGNLAACRVAVNAGRDAATRVGKVIAAHVIGRPDTDTEDMVLNRIPHSAGTPKPKKSASSDTSGAQRAPIASSAPVKSKPARVHKTVTHTTVAQATTAPPQAKPARGKKAAPLPAEQAKRLKADKQGKALAQAARQWADSLLGEMSELATASPAEQVGVSASGASSSSKGKSTAPKK